ncbi:DUF5666 domain-containing protein [Nocardia otitidiscaviarum]|uniref:DUF5666 domain-containing protein n=1 Tax=Nocardia otitidiscaviarum TaxID=1823 RepID=UPI00189493A9|nr:DUF5666 domain-containing protein [Nocardia otitidiscaviarum]MBF6183184.1 hypothetical protein [Nocardia otitidiscaviarum]
MTNPSDPWSRRPESGSVDGPTEQVSPAAGSTGHTSDSDPTTAYDYFAQQPGPEATRVLPPHDDQWGGYESGAPSAYPPTATYTASGHQAPGYQGGGYQSGGYQAGGYPGSGPASYPPAPGGPGGPVPPGGYQPGYPGGGPQPPQRRTGLWIGLGLAALALVALAGVVVGTLLADRDTSNTASTTSRTQQVLIPTFPSETAQPLPSGVPQIPGLGEIDELGATMGTIASNDGSTLTIATLSGPTVTVHTDDRTQVISLGSVAVRDLPIGEMVMVQGDKAADGSVTAKIIISTALPGGTR